MPSPKDPGRDRDFIRVQPSGIHGTGVFARRTIPKGTRVIEYAGRRLAKVDLLILDEPTMGLSLKETAKLVTFVKGIKQAGKSAIFIDHNILHVYNVADRVVVLDRGKIAGEFQPKNIGLSDLMAKMVRVAETGSLD